MDQKVIILKAKASDRQIYYRDSIEKNLDVLVDFYETLCDYNDIIEAWVDD